MINRMTDQATSNDGSITMLDSKKMADQSFMTMQPCTAPYSLVPTGSHDSEVPDSRAGDHPAHAAGKPLLEQLCRELPSLLVGLK